MSRRTSISIALFLVCLVAAYLIFRPHNQLEARSSLAASLVTASNVITANPARVTLRSASTMPLAPVALVKQTNAPTAKELRESRLKYRLANTTQTAGQLSHNDHAILLENAQIDTGAPVNYSIPDALKSQGDPGTYIVQARGKLNNAFRTALASAGAGVVSYIPNNAYLVRASAGIAQQLEGNPLVQSVLPYEPYYKLSLSLLGPVVEQQALPGELALSVVVFADARAVTLDALQKLGAQVMSESPSPFGPLLTVKPALGTVASIAGLAGVQTISLLTPRKPANDLSRPIVSVAADTVTPFNWWETKPSSRRN